METQYQEVMQEICTTPDVPPERLLMQAQWATSQSSLERLSFYNRYNLWPEEAIRKALK